MTKLSDNLKLCQRLISDCCTDEDRRTLVLVALGELENSGYQLIDKCNGKEAVKSHVAAIIRKAIFGEL